jgi:DNA polymerase theta
MFVMTSELHACFLCAPLDDGLPMYDSHWRRLYAVVTQIQSSGGPDFEAMKRIGLQPGLVQARSRGVGAPRGGDSDQDRVCRRFFAARVLQDLIQEVSPEQAAARYELPPRAVEELGRGAARWAATGRAFCERMGWPEMGAVLASFGARVEHGARADVLPLTEIRGVKAGTARLLYDAGLVSPREVAEAAGRDVRRALARGAPFKGRSEAEMMKLIRSQARAIQEEAQKLLRRQAKELMAAAAAGPGGRGRGRGKQRRREEDADSEPTEAEPKRARPAPRQQPAAAPAPAAPPPAAPPPGAPPPPPPPPPGGEPSQPDPDESDLAAAREAEAAARAAASAAAAKAAKAKAAKAAWPSRPGGAGEPGGAFRDAPGLQLASSLAAVQGLAALLRRAQRFGLDFHVVPFERADGALIEAAGMQVPPGPGRRAARKPPPRRDAVDFDADEPPPPPQGTVLGLAVSWAPGRAAYVPLHPAAPPGAAAALAAALADPGVEAVAYGWKQQVAACRWLMAHAPDASTSTSTSAGASPPPPRLPPGMLDARVAAWMAAPDSPYVIDGLMGERTASIPGCNVPQGAHKSPRTPEALLTLISGSPAAGDAACAGLRLRAGGGGGVPGGGVVAARLAALAAALYEAVLPQLEAAGLLRALRSTEMPLVAVLADMEEGGVGLDPGAIRRLAPRLQRRLGEVQRAAHRAAGGSFDIASPKQVSDLLFRRLKLPPPPAAQQVRPRKDGTTYVALSARKEILEALAGAHPVVPLISEFRKLTDTLGFALDLLKRGDVEAGLDAARAAERGGGGGAAGGGGEAGGGEGVLRLRGFYLHTAVSSGRVAMEEPNLQCVPRTHAFVAAPSPEGDGDAGGGGGGGPPERTPGGAHSQFEANLRAAIVPTRDMGPGAAIISADFRQIEFRLMAHFSGDAGLRAMLADGGQDPFASLASTWRGVPLDRVTPDQRNHAKGIVYGLCYGMGSAAMGAKLGVSPKVAARLRAEFLDTFSGVAAWLRSAAEEARAAGFVRTLHGRRRWLPGLSSDDQGARAQAERAAVNSICQGSAADVAKAAMVAIHARLRAELPPGAARLVHQIHDELLVEVRREHVGAAAALVRGCMEGAAALEVPLRARLAAGPSWGEVEELREERVLCPRVSPRR